MRAGLFSVLGVVLIVMLALWLWPHEAQKSIVDARGQDEVSIVLTDDGFIPRYVRINKGTNVIFTTTRQNQFWPASNEHPSHTIYPAFDAKRPLEPHESWSFTFDRAGEWGLHDHVRSYYTGIIYVE